MDALENRQEAMGQGCVVMIAIRLYDSVRLFRADIACNVKYLKRGSRRSGYGNIGEKQNRQQLTTRHFA